MKSLGRAWTLAVALACGGVAHAGQTADVEDIYVMGWAGWRSTQQLQVGGGVGYVFADGFGLGALYEQSGAMPFVAAEIRWFLEPFESAIAFGVEDRGGESTERMTPMFTLCGDYLFSLTPSLALRASVKWLLPLDSASGVFTGLGGRLLF